MTNEFISPNWHPLFLHYPIALLMLGVIIEIIGSVSPRGGFRAAGRWMMLLGALLAIPTATLGIYAFRDVVTPAGLDAGPHWQQIAQRSPWSAQQWDFMETHIWLNSFATVLFLVATVFWLAGSDNWRRSARIPLLLVMLVGVGLMGAGAWYGGELVYRFGTGVVTADAPPASPAERGIQYYLPPFQSHLVLAGLAVAFIVGAFGLMIRRWQLDSAALIPLSRDRVAIEPAVTETGEPVTRAERVELRSQGPYGEERVAVEEPPKAYPGWFWLGAVLLGLATAVAGYWSVMGAFTRQALEENWEELQEADHRRLLLHVIFGVSIVVLSLILAALVRFARRSRVLAGILGSIVLLLIAGQVWLGVLMTYDGHSGPLVGFADVAAAGQPQKPAAPPSGAGQAPDQPAPVAPQAPADQPTQPASPPAQQETAPQGDTPREEVGSGGGSQGI